MFRALAGTGRALEVNTTQPAGVGRPGALVPRGGRRGGQLRQRRPPARPPSASSSTWRSTSSRRPASGRAATGSTSGAAERGPGPRHHDQGGAGGLAVPVRAVRHRHGGHASRPSRPRRSTWPSASPPPSGGTRGSCRSDDRRRGRRRLRAGRTRRRAAYRWSAALRTTVYLERDDDDVDLPPIRAAGPARPLHARTSPPGWDRGVTSPCAGSWPSARRRFTTACSAGHGPGCLATRACQGPAASPARSAMYAGRMRLGQHGALADDVGLWPQRTTRVHGRRHRLRARLTDADRPDQVLHR